MKSCFLKYSILFCTFFLLKGCDERVINPFEGSEVVYFSMYGAVDLEEPVNYIRIKDYETFFLTDSSVIREPVVTMENRSTGIITELRDSIINFSGNFTYNYIIDQPLDPDTEYEVIATSPEEEISRTILHTPGITEAGNGLSQSEETIIVEPFNCETLETFYFNNVNLREHIRMDVGFNYEGEIQWGSVNNIRTPKPVDGIDRHQVSLTITNLLVEVFPRPPEAYIGVEREDWLPAVFCNDLDEARVYIRYIHFSEDWYELRNTSLDGILLLESQKIESGLGFVGAIRRGSYDFGIQFTD